MKKQKKITLVLDNIRSSENVGSIFRTADAMGVSKIYLSGYTPAPVDRFGRENKKLTKASLGAEKTVSWEQVSDTAELVKKRKEAESCCVAVEQHKKSTPFHEADFPQDVTFIFGNEVKGLSEAILANVDLIAEIPMFGMKESLNVSVTVGIILSRFVFPST